MNKLSPIIKWPGGKEKELKVIVPNLPSNIENYYEPFVGGGSVFTNVSAKKYFLNDKSNELISLYKSIQNNNLEFYNYTEKINSLWQDIHNFVAKEQPLFREYKSLKIKDYENLKDLLASKIELLIDGLYGLAPKDFFIRNIFETELSKNIYSKIKHMLKLEEKITQLPEEDIILNIECGIKSGVYTYFRKLYNAPDLINNNNNIYTSLFLFIRNYAYSGMFRYNSNGEFNVPYGGIGYNDKYLTKKLSYYKSKELSQILSKSYFYNQDFYDFMKSFSLSTNDFVFLDPPYDSDFSTYAKNEFGQEDQIRLANYLCTECNSKWMMIIKSTPFILSLYENKGLNISSFDKKYLVSFMNRNNKEVTHLLIKNY